MWVSGLIRDQKTTQSWDAFNAGHTFHILARERKHLRVQSGLVSLFFIMTHLINSLWHWSNNQRWSLLHLETAFSVATSISNFRHYPDIIQWIFFFFSFRNLFLLLFPPTSASPVTPDKLRTLYMLPLPCSPAVLPALVTPSSRPSPPPDHGLPSPRSY